MPGPFRIFIGGSELLNFTDAKLSRSKDDLTGSLSLSLFMSYVPGEPVMTFAGVGNEVLVYIGNEIAFTGKVDIRGGTGSHSGDPGTKNTPTSMRTNGGPIGSVNIGPNEYTVKIQARGKTKIAVDSSQKHKTGQMNRPTNRDVVDALLEGTNIQVEWLATTIKLDKVRFRDGATIWEELQRVGNENAHFIYQTRDGKLRVTDDTGRTVGDPLILGENILTFNAEQSEDESRSEIKVKGQRTPNEVWGRDAVVDIEKIVQDGSSTNLAPVTIQHYGDGSPEALERRAKFEANKRVSASKSVTVTVFHVQANGSPWDVGNLHYVEIPPEGIFEVFECTGVDYDVNAKDTLQTTLTLSPAPSGGISGSVGGGFNFTTPAIEELINFGISRRAQLGVTTQPGQYPASWGGAVLSIIDPINSLFNLLDDVATGGLDDKELVPTTIPSALRESRT